MKKRTNINSFKKKILLIVVVSLLTQSCVGTIEDANIQTTKSAGTSISPIKFEGVYRAIPIAHNKVDILFFPASGGSGDYTYLISYDGISTPISVPSSTLKLDYRGLHKVTVPSLSINTTYSFQVQIVDESTGGKSFTEVAVAATTFPNLTCNFEGIGSVAPLSGANGLNAINVTWAEGETIGSTIFAEEPDPYQYVVTIIDSDLLNPGDMNNDTFTEPERKVFYFNRTKRNVNIYGLTSGKKYFVQVRCEHEGYNSFGFDQSYLREENTNHTQITTLLAGAAGITWPTSQISLSLGPGASGLNTLQLDWPGAIGAFDHYRAYSTRNEVGDPGLNTAITVSPSCQNSCYASASNCGGSGCLTRSGCYADSGHWVNCKKLPLNEISTLLVGLEEQKSHEAKLLVCQDINCTIFVESPVLSIITRPDLASFDGIVTIDKPKSFDDLGSLWINLLPPQVETGLIDGVLVEFVGQLDSDTPVILNGAPDFTNSSNLTVVPFDYQTVTEIEVQGINPYSALKYCFKAYGFTYSGAGVIIPQPVETQQNPVCVYPSPNYITPPDNLQFLGLSSCTLLSESISLAWALPSEGVYEKIEVFWKDNSVGSPFNFNDAVAEANSGAMVNYKRALIDGSKINYVVTSLDPSKSYTFAALSYMAGLDGVEYRSNFNSGIRTCSPAP